MNRPFLAPFVSDRRIWLLLLSVALAIVLGFVAIPDFAAIVFVSRTGFWFVLVAFALFLRALWQTWGGEVRTLRWRSVDWASVGVVALGGTILLVHESYGFKIVMDEIMLLGTSMSMHLDKTVLTPVRGSDIQGAFVILDGMMDKRPLFFPFLASLLHDLTGYRPANAFILNSALTFLFLGLINATGRLLAGRLAGWLGVALFAGLPLLAHNATGGGFELLNLVMIVATMLLGARFLEKRDEPALTAFCFSALLLAQVRYESVIWLLPVALTVLWVWYREGRAILSWPVMFAPLLMIHYPLQHRIFDLRASAWELGSKPGSSTPFALHYVPDNLSHALRYFFGNAAEQPNSLVLSALGCIAAPFFALLVIKRLRALAVERPMVVATSFFAIGFAVQFVLLMCYFYGQFDDIIIRRLSLPTQLGMVVAVLAVLPEFANAAVGRGLLALAAFGLLARSVPSMAAHAYSQEYLPGKETAWRREFIAKQTRRDYLVIDNDSIMWIAHQISATPVFQAKGPRRSSLVFLMRNRAFSDVYVFQRYNIDADTGKMTLRDGDDLGPDFVLETVREERLQTLTLSRLSRLKEIRNGAESLTAPDPVVHAVPKDRGEIEKTRRAYLENYVKMLP
ncbi:MAG: hypothetical protein NTV51_10480 [Verrucomicrobia bacterium]|nr:hypothetical protein [Verrucomicrobiota bacterium]